MKEKTEIVLTLHTDQPIPREQAEAINKAVSQIGPIQLAGMALEASHKRAEKALIHAAANIQINPEQKTIDPNPPFLEEWPKEPMEETEELKKELAEAKAELQRINREMEEMTRKNDVK